VPYDFDMAGFVNADHGKPNSRFKLRSNRERLYRGRCVYNSYLPTSVEFFLDKRDEIYELINTQELISKGTRKLQLRFANSFFKSIDSSRKIEKNLVDDCI
jgi:hypothetical protein